MSDSTLRNDVDCPYWLQGDCKFEDSCWFRHVSATRCFTELTAFQAHEEKISGIQMPTGTKRVFTSSVDGMLKEWHAETLECVAFLDLGAPIFCLDSNTFFILCGMKEILKAYDLGSASVLEHPVPKVGDLYALASNGAITFAGAEDGSILKWQFDDASLSIKPEAFAQRTHSSAVSCLTFAGAERLVSGANDGTIKVWNVENLECLHTLRAHGNAVTSAVWWSGTLLTSSLDKTIKVWEIKGRQMVLIYSLTLNNGLLGLWGVVDSFNRSVLLASSSNKSITAFCLPSFDEIGKLLARDEFCITRQIESGVVLTGDKCGNIGAYDWNTGQVPMEF